MAMQPLTNGVLLWPAVQEDTESGFPVWIQQEKLAIVPVPDVCYQ